MKKILILYCVLVTIQGKAQQADSVRLFVDSALNLMQSKSLYSKDLNWKIISDSVHTLVKNANTYEETAPALRFAFNLLQDKHGWLVINGKDYHNPFVLRDDSRINQATKSVITKPSVRSKLLQNKYAYLSIPFFGGQTLTSMNAFAQRVQVSLCRVLSPSVKGIIIDLRLNGGGNMYPMIIGISNVIGDGKFTGSVNSKGDNEGWLEMKNHTITLLDTMVIKLQKTCGNLESKPVAVLIGPATGSSGEQLAIILSLRKKTILIGEPTAGYVTGNNGYLLPGHENGIVLAESYTIDRNGKIYLKDVEPAIRFNGGDNFSDLSEDEKIKAAIRWINNQ